MLKHGVLLVAVRPAAIVEPDQACQCDATVDDLTTDEDVEGIAELELAGIVEEGGDVVVRVYLLDGDLAIGHSGSCSREDFLKGWDGLSIQGE